MVLIAGRPTPSELAEPPAHLPDAAKAFWRETVLQLVEIGMVDRVDIPALEMLSVQYARICSIREVIDEVGFFARGSTGQITEHPALKIEREATALFLKLAEHYGLTPIARARLGLAEVHRRSLAAELDGALGSPDLRPIGHG